MFKRNQLFYSIALLFILSGIAGLIYQVTWFKQLSYFLGNSTYAQSILLGTFMGGLAIGSWYWGKKADSARNALRTFGVLEILIAIYCFFYQPIFNGLNSLFTIFVSGYELDSDSTTVFLARLFVSCIAILPPTILMGGTLPILVRYFSNKLQDVGRNISILYFLNSLGAVIGTVLAGFYLLEWFGLQWTTFTGAFMDLSVGGVSLWFAGKINLTTELETAENDKKLIKVDNYQSKVVVAIAAISGFCAMGYEVIWLRLLIPVLSSSTYSFTIILASFITGITIGSFVIYKYGPKIKNPFLYLGLFQLFIVLAIQFSLPFYERLPFLIWNSVGDPDTNTVSYGSYLFTQLFYVFLLLIVPTIFMGMSLPLATRLAVKKVNDTGAIVGKVFAFNTLGTVAGSLFVGLVLIPALGIMSSLNALLVLNITLVILVFRHKESSSRINKIVAVSLIFLSTLIHISTMKNSSWMYTIMLSEAPRKINRIAPPKNFNEFLKKSKNHEKIHFYKEGPNGTFVVAENNGEIYLFTNGKGDANSKGDLRTQVSLGLTPVILHESPDSIFVIGFGAGTTIGNAMSHPRVKYGEVAEISKEVVTASKYFEEINAKPLSRENLNVITDDGVSALRLSPHKFDVIISQPSNPWSAGVGNLFTTEFFQSCKEKLRPGGMVAQWFNLYEMDEKSLKLILRTVLSEFEHINLWHIGSADILMICSNDPIPNNIERIKKSYNMSSEELKKIDIYSFGAFLSQEFIGSENNLITYAGEGPLNTEDHPLLEHWAPRAYFNNSRPESFYPLDERSSIEENEHLLLSQFLKSNEINQNEILQAALFQATGGSKELAFYLADLNPIVYDYWSKKAEKLGDKNLAREYKDKYLKAMSKQGSIGETITNNDNLSNENVDLSSPEKIIEALKSNPNDASLYYKLGGHYMNSKNPEAAAKAFETAIRLDVNLVDAYINLGIVYGQQNQLNKAIDILNKAAKITSGKNAKVLFNRGYAKALNNDISGSIKDFSQSIQIEPSNPQAYLLRGRSYLSIGDKKCCQDFLKAKELGSTEAQQWLNKFCK